MRAIFDETVHEWGNNANFNFNPMVKHSEVFIKPRAKYMAEVLRQVAMVSQEKGTVAVVDLDMLPFIESAWRNDLPKEMQQLKKLI